MSTNSIVGRKESLKNKVVKRKGIRKRGMLKAKR